MFSSVFPSSILSLRNKKIKSPHKITNEIRGEKNPSIQPIKNRHKLHPSYFPHPPVVQLPRQNSIYFTNPFFSVNYFFNLSFSELFSIIPPQNWPYLEENYLLMLIKHFETKDIYKKIGLFWTYNIYYIKKFNKLPTIND